MLRAAVFVLLAFGCSDPTSGSLANAAPNTAAPVALVTDPLPSWNDRATKRALIEFVERVTREGGSDFVPLEERIAVFDNDGTLWTEQPYPPQLAFVFDRMKRADSRELLGDSAIEGSAETHQLLELLANVGSGSTTDEYEQAVGDWIATAIHPRFKRHYTELVYQPMLEVLAFLRSRGFKTYLVSGDETDFMRVWAERTYGIPAEQVIGTRLALRYEQRADGPALVRLPHVDLADDKAGKAIGIEEMIGRRPIIAFGNSDGDIEMLEWTTSAPRNRLGLLVHHTDAVREYAYDRDARFGKLSRALDEGKQRGWLVVDMKRDWKVVFPFERR
jgi:phosphoserine phosphatase